jgi:hypothetical protein
VSGLQVVRFVRHLVRPPSVVVVHLRRLRARVLLSSDCVRGVAASGVLARVRRAWLVVDGVGELVLDRGGGSYITALCKSLWKTKFEKSHLTGRACRGQTPNSSQWAV